MCPVFHHEIKRVDGRLFISVLAYHLVHTIRCQLKAQGIHLSGEGLRAEFEGQERLTVVLRLDDCKRYQIRRATQSEPRQQAVYDALSVVHMPGRTEKPLIDPQVAAGSQME